MCGPRTHLDESLHQNEEVPPGAPPEREPVRHAVDRHRSRAGQGRPLIALLEPVPQRAHFKPRKSALPSSTPLCLSSAYAVVTWKYRLGRAK